MGVLPDRLPGYAYTDNAGAREMLEQIWGGAIPSAKGMTAPEMVEAAQSGKLKALYVMGANPWRILAPSATGVEKRNWWWSTKCF